MQDHVIDTINGATEFPFFGTITYYTFSDILSDPTITSLNVQNSYNESINLNLFIVPSMSFVNPTSGPPKYIVRAAVSFTTSYIRVPTKFP